MRERVCRSGTETRLQKITRRRKFMVRKDTSFVAITLENFNIANFYNASIHKIIREGSCRTLFVPFEQVFCFRWKLEELCE